MRGAEVDMEDVRIYVDVTPPMKLLLERLVNTGLYGTTPQSAARRLLEQGLEEALRNDLIDKLDD